MKVRTSASLSLSLPWWPATTIFGPFEDPAVYPMQQALGAIGGAQAHIALHAVGVACTLPELEHRT